MHCSLRSWCLALVAVLGLVPVDGCSHHHHHGRDITFTEEQLAELERKWGTDWTFSGIGSFGHLEYAKCLTTPSELYDIAIIGAPFDTAVSYRPGARFGPRAIRQASARQSALRGFNHRAGVNPYRSWARILDCGDIPVTPMDNAVALLQMTEAFSELGRRLPATPAVQSRPKLITLGGDHSLALPALRALNRIHGQTLRVIHFDAHLDTWHPNKYPSAWPSEQAQFNHGSMFWLAGQEGLLSNVTGAPSVHAGLRTRLTGDDYEDWDEDTNQNWVRLTSDDMDDVGVAGITKAILDNIGDNETPVYLSVDIDVLDPAFAPGTGTPEPGGWTTRELIRVLRGLEGLNIVGADIVEVAPAYQGPGEETALAAAQVVYEIMTSMVKKGLTAMGKEGDVKKEVAKEETKSSTSTAAETSTSTSTTDEAKESSTSTAAETSTSTTDEAKESSTSTTAETSTSTTDETTETAESTTDKVTPAPAEADDEKPLTEKETTETTTEAATETETESETATTTESKQAEETEKDAKKDEL